MTRLFKPGDRVTLASGGPVMEVIKYAEEEEEEEEGLLGKEVNDHKVQCVWYDSRNGRMKEVFHQRNLIRAPLINNRSLYFDTSGTSTIYGSLKNAIRNLTHREAEETFDQLYAAITFLNRYDYTQEFTVDNENFISMKDGRKYKPEEVTIVKAFHFEGFTNIDDMSVLYAIKTDDGSKGWISNAYGLFANGSLDKLLVKVKQGEKATL